MITDELHESLRQLGALAVARLREDAALRDALRRLLDALGPPGSAATHGPPLRNGTDDASASDAGATVARRPPAAPAAVPMNDTPAVVAPALPLPPLTFGSAPAAPVDRSPGSPAAPLVQRAASGEPDRQRGLLQRAMERLDARATQLRGHDASADADHEDPHASDAFPEASTADRSLLAHAFANAAAAMRLATRVAEGPGRAGQAYQHSIELVAESLSALRIALARVGEEADADHLAAFSWLKVETKAQSIYVARHMRLDDPADPFAWPALADRLAAALRPLDDARRRAATFNKLRYHAKRVRASIPLHAEDDEEIDLSDWRTIAAATADLVRNGLPPSNVDLRDEWIDLFDAVPETLELPAEVERVLEQVEPALAARAAAGHAEPAAGEPRRWSAQVDAVRERLHGRSLVVIGGEARPHHVARLRSAFGLSAVDWIATRSHESHYGFEAAIRRPEVACVLLLIRWTSHSYAEVERFCRETGKPLIRMPKGYHPNAVATQVIDQAGEMLGITVPA